MRFSALHPKPCKARFFFHWQTRWKNSEKQLSEFFPTCRNTNRLVTLVSPFASFFNIFSPLWEHSPSITTSPPSMKALLSFPTALRPTWLMAGPWMSCWLGSPEWVKCQGWMWLTFSLVLKWWWLIAIIKKSLIHVCIYVRYLGIVCKLWTRRYRKKMFEDK